MRHLKRLLKATWGSEVDFVLYGKDCFLAVEVKSGNAVARNDLSGLVRYLAEQLAKCTSARQTKSPKLCVGTCLLFVLRRTRALTQLELRSKKKLSALRDSIFSVFIKKKKKASSQKIHPIFRG